MSSDSLNALLLRLTGREPNQLLLYTEAFTHGSTGKAKDYQRLEFLGDRVLGLAIAELLYEAFPNDAEGLMSARLNRLVSGTTCAEVARGLNLSEHIILGKQARDDGGRDSSNILGDVMESLIGAIFLDMGPATARDFVRCKWQPLLDTPASAIKHPKSALQEWAASQNRKMPVYALVSKSGPHHALSFTVSVTVQGIGSAEASGTSKQEAETAAAITFLETYT